MKLQKIGLSFTSYSDADFLKKAEHILACMTLNAAFKSPVPPLEQLEAAVSSYRDTLVAAEGLGRIVVAEKNKSRLALEAIIAQLGMWVMFVANGDVAILTSSGYTLNKFPEPRYITNPGNVTLTNGVTTGQMVASVKGVKGAGHFLHQISGEPPIETTVWESTPSSRSRFVFTNLLPGKQYWVRIAAVASGEQIAYSPIASQFAQ